MPGDARYQPDAVAFDPKMLGRKGTGFGGDPEAPVLEAVDLGDHFEIVGHQWGGTCVAHVTRGQPTRFLLLSAGEPGFVEAVARWRKENAV
ncbi:MAG TPA: hypothetical protein VGG39_24930 [Polyangiaceae bacterium]|jgi:hypothetical protein